MVSGAKILQSDKRELIRLLLEERDEMRCTLVKELMHEAKVLTADLDPRIEELEKKIAELRAEYENLREKKAHRLCDARLFVFNHNKTSRTPHPAHPKLAAFDDETREKEREILLIGK